MRHDRIDRIAFDIGGTFTDVIVQWSDGRLQTAKIPSLLETIGRDITVNLKIENVEVKGFIHGTTVAANALLEGKLAPVGLVTTAGFRDVLEMRSQRRPNINDMNWDRLASLVPRELRLELRERVMADGTIERALDPQDAAEAIDTLAEAGVAAIAVCLINSYANGAHEHAIAADIRRRYPHIAVSCSAEEFAEIREYERTSTTVVNASLMPVVDEYLSRIEAQLRVPDTGLLIMQSNGGLMNSRIARRRPVQIIESGPAAGVLAAARLAQELDLPRVLAFDMGGTTAKASLIEAGVPAERPGGEVGGGANLATRFFGGAGHAIRVPAFDIAEVGAGGGSLAWIDRGGALRVGPEGAGATPGPVCYRRGGTQPTVTDANVVLGYINPRAIAAATVEIDRDVAADAITRLIARPLGLSLVDAAHGIIQVANATTMRAIRAVTIERGVDPRKVVILAFGGGGPVHGAQLAAAVGVTDVYVPPFPGIFSAVGLLLADYRHDTVRSLVMPLDQLRPAVLLEHYQELERTVRAVMELQGVDAAAVRLRPEIDVQYRGQHVPLTVPLPEIIDGIGAALLAAFQEAHRSVYGYERNDPVEIVSLRMRATSPAGDARITDLARTAAYAGRVTGTQHREAYFGPGVGFAETPVIDRGGLDTEFRRGPLIIEEWDTSTIVPPDWLSRRDAAGNIVLKHG